MLFCATWWVVYVSIVLAFNRIIVRLLRRDFSLFRVYSFLHSFIGLCNINVRVVCRLVFKDRRARMIQTNRVSRVEE